MENKTGSTDLANRIKTLRAKLGWTQEILAKEASVSLATIRKIESSSRFGRKDTLQNLARVLGTSESFLAYGVEEIFDSGKQPEHIVLPQNLNSEDRSLVERYIRNLTERRYLEQLGNIVTPNVLPKNIRTRFVVEEADHSNLGIYPAPNIVYLSIQLLPDGTAKILVIENATSHGFSVLNGIHTIATQIVKQYKLDPLKAQWIIKFSTNSTKLVSVNLNWNTQSQHYTVPDVETNYSYFDFEETEYSAEAHSARKSMQESYLETTLNEYTIERIWIKQFQEGQKRQTRGQTD